jgi:hypothetical protein
MRMEPYDAVSDRSRSTPPIKKPRRSSESFNPVAEHRGPQVFGKGRHRNPLRSTHPFTAYRWGHKWGVLALLVKFP